MTIGLSVFITVLILTVVFGVSSVLTKGVAASAPGSDQTAEYYATREAQYQLLLAQANDTINQANLQISTLQSQTQAPVDPTATPYPVLLDQALAIATNVAGETSTGAPSLVNYNGKIAYEVVFPSGKVYVDATTGKILFNGVLVSRMVTEQQASQIAVAYTGNTQVTEVVSGLYNGYSAYRISFANGEIVYVNIYGKVLAVQLPVIASGESRSEHEEEDDD